MKILGIIAEYNPFHNGHKYHIQKAKEVTGADFVVVVMSGNFTQTGNVAIYDKFSRAKIACEYGADLVIELPIIYTSSSAKTFAFGAIMLLNRLGIVDYICFGSETANIDDLQSISNLLQEKNNDINTNIKLELKKGISYPKARENVLSEYLNKDQIDVINKSNNILGIEYLEALNKLNSKIIPYCIKRESSEYNDIFPQKNSKKYTSATSIRNMIKLGKYDLIEKFVPASSYTNILNSEPLFNEKLYKILKYKILTTSNEELKNISEVTEGLENKLKSEIFNSSSYEELIYNLKSKRYTMTKIRRMLINVLLGITKEQLQYSIKNQITYAHILAIGYNGKTLLSQLSNNSHIKVITKINDNILKSLDEDIARYVHMDILASNIYYTLSNDIINKDYTNRL